MNNPEKLDYSEDLRVFVITSGSNDDQMHFEKTGWPRAPVGTTYLDNIRQAAAEVIESDVESRIFYEQSDTAVIKMMTVNDLTRDITAYRLERHTIKVNWAKAIPTVAKAAAAVGSFSLGWLGFLGVAIFLYNFLKESGVKLTNAEAAVFTAVYTHRNEHKLLPESDLAEKVQIVAKDSRVLPPTGPQINEALNTLIDLGILKLDDGNIILLDEWVIHGSWR
ncbi:MAG: hypothetical protein GC165_12830 [Armatimonadetes bacterium]|nr:hypothetical protein [Armatimonadota bacterium]MBS1726033.1 hypothetical protein [Armatimonadota bacterium]